MWQPPFDPYRPKRRIWPVIDDADPAPEPKAKPQPAPRAAADRQVVRVPMLCMDSSKSATASPGDRKMKTVIVDGQPFTVDPAVARQIERLEGERDALRAMLGDRRAMADAATASARQAQAAMIEAERRMRDPSTPLGSYIQRTERAWMNRDAG